MQLTILLSILLFGLAPREDKSPTNQHFWYSMETTAPAESIWSLWVDVPNWKRWDSGLKDASINGHFVLNATGTILSLEDRKSKFEVVEFVEGKSYSIKTKLPLGSLQVKRYLQSKDGKTVFTHEVWFKGLTKGIFSRMFGGKFREMLPDVLLNIQKIVEENGDD